MDEQVLRRLASAVVEMRGDRSQRDFARLLGVAQSTVQAWENGKNTPSLENLEKLARMRGDLPEEFVAFLFGRLVGSGSLPIEDRIDGMSCHQLAGLMRRVADRLGQES